MNKNYNTIILQKTPQDIILQIVIILRPYLNSTEQKKLKKRKKILQLWLTLKNCGDFFNTLVFGLRHTHAHVDDEQELDREENDEHVGPDGQLQGREGHADDEIGQPVDRHRDGDGQRPAGLLEQLRDKEPGDGAGPGGEADHKEVHCHDRNHRKGTEMHESLKKAESCYLSYIRSFI